MIASTALRRFQHTLDEHQLALIRSPIQTLQVNIGKRCNQACHHCHVESGPNRTENMQRHTVQRLLALIDGCDSLQTVDITGGAPEMNPHFRFFVAEIRARGIEVIDRCNLSILFEPGQHDTAEFLAEHKVKVVASLPCYLEDNVDKQRGKGVFDKSIQGLQRLNQLGYGQTGSGLELNLVYNPTGIHLPPAQHELEADYRSHLWQHFNIVFNQLFTITNMPIKRFAHQLNREGRLDEYMQLLLDNFNPGAAENVMCKTMLSIGWDGAIYDCDFNQMLEIPAQGAHTIFDIDALQDISDAIALDDHCYGCTAGAGSSCGGALTE